MDNVGQTKQLDAIIFASWATAALESRELCAFLGREVFSHHAAARVRCEPRPHDGRECAIPAKAATRACADILAAFTANLGAVMTGNYRCVEFHAQTLACMSSR